MSAEYAGEVTYKKKGHIVYMTIDGPGDLNPMNPGMYQQLFKAMKEYDADDDALVAIITGAGDKAFTCGGDIKVWMSNPEELSGPKVIRRGFWQPDTDPYADLWRLLTFELWKPVIGAVNGYCLGIGFIIMLCCTDIRVASEHATFGFEETKRGLGGGAAFTQLSPQIPHAVAMYMILTANRIDAQEAYRVGLVNKVVPHTELISETERIAHDICEIAPIVTRLEKESTLRWLRPHNDLQSRFIFALRALQLHSEDATEGIDAFFQKRKPTWKGR